MARNAHGGRRDGVPTRTGSREGRALRHGAVMAGEDRVISGDAIDSLDVQIIAHLRRDGRTSNRELARILGYSEATVRRRVRALIDDGRIRIIAIADPHVLGYAIDVIIGVEVQPGRVNEVAASFAALENVRAVTITTGASDLVVAAIFRSNDELLSFLSKDVGSIEGVLRTSTAYNIRVVKRAFDLFPEQWP
jgi:Lrp/AsnC family transcriptional regulator for asnA, asnC and gidA